MHVTALVVWCMEGPAVQVSYRMQRSSPTVYLSWLPFNPLFHQHVSVKMEALVVGTHAPVHLGTQEHFAPLAPLHVLLVISLTTAPAAVVSVMYVCVCVCICDCVVCVCLVMLSYKKH